MECLLAQSFHNYQLLLIDDGSTDGTAEMVRSFIPEVKIIRGNGDWWWGGSLQQAYLCLISEAHNPDDIVLLINDDTEFPSDFLEKAKTILSNSKHMVLQSIARDGSGNVMERGFKVNWPFMRFRSARSDEEPDCGTTRGLFLKYSDFKRLGGFYPKLLPHYGSDIEYTCRIKRKGLRIIVKNEVWLNMMTAETGAHRLESKALIPYIRGLFSKKTSHNPIYGSILVLLCWPWWAVLPALVKVWLLPVVEFAGMRRKL